MTNTTGSTGAGRMSNDLNESAGRIKRDVGEAAGAVSEDIQDMARRAGTRVRNVAQSAGRSASDFAEVTYASIREKPLRSVGIAAALGFVVGFLFRR